MSEYVHELDSNCPRGDTLGIALDRSAKQMASMEAVTRDLYQATLGLTSVMRILIALLKQREDLDRALLAKVNKQIEHMEDVSTPALLELTRALLSRTTA